MYSCDTLYRFLNFICMKIDKKFTIYLELTTFVYKFMSQNCVDLRTHLYPTS